MVMTMLDEGILLEERLKQTVERYSTNKTGFKLLESNLTSLDGNMASILVYLESIEVDGQKVEMNFTELNSIKVESSNYNPYQSFYTGYGIGFFY